MRTFEIDFVYIKLIILIQISVIITSIIYK